MLVPGQEILQPETRWAVTMAGFPLPLEGGRGESGQLGHCWQEAAGLAPREDWIDKGPGKLSQHWRSWAEVLGLSRPVEPSLCPELRRLPVVVVVAWPSVTH